MAKHKVILTTEIDALQLVKRGKVRDIYAVDPGELLIVATDRISAFDCILPAGIPGKGTVLTQLSRFWFEQVAGEVETHMITADFMKLPELLRANHPELQGRTMLARRAEVIPFECVVRGYLAGSGWREYCQDGNVSGVNLPPGLVEAARLIEPIFTPSVKSDTGHDLSVSEATMADQVGADLTQRLKEISLQLYQLADHYLSERDLILADTKFEFGTIEGNIVWVDEAITPDSSRFWDRRQYTPGKPQRSFDKQIVRDYLLRMGWQGSPPAPDLPAALVDETSWRYQEVYERITGERV